MTTPTIMERRRSLLRPQEIHVGQGPECDCPLSGSDPNGALALGGVLAQDP